MPRYYYDFSDPKVYCSECNELMKGHVDDFMLLKNSGIKFSLNNKCIENTSIFIGNCWRRYNMEDGTLGPHSCSDCCCDDDGEKDHEDYLTKLAKEDD